MKFHNNNNERTSEKKSPINCDINKTDGLIADERNKIQFTLLSFLYQVSVANGLPPDEMHSNFWTEPAGIIDPSLYPDIIGADGGSVVNFSLVHIEDK